MGGEEKPGVQNAGDGNLRVVSSVHGSTSMLVETVRGKGKADEKWESLCDGCGSPGTVKWRKLKRFARCRAVSIESSCVGIERTRDEELTRSFFPSPYQVRYCCHERASSPRSHSKERTES